MEDPRGDHDNMGDNMKAHSFKRKYIKAHDFMGSK